MRRVLPFSVFSSTSSIRPPGQSTIRSGSPEVVGAILNDIPPARRTPSFSIFSRWDSGTMLGRWLKPVRFGVSGRRGVVMPGTVPHPGLVRYSPPPAAYLSNLWVVARKATLLLLPVTPRNWYVTTLVTSFDQRLVTGNGTCSYTRN